MLKLTNRQLNTHSSKISKRAGKLYAKHLLKNKRPLKRILPDFIIYAHSEHHSDANGCLLNQKCSFQP